VPLRALLERYARGETDVCEQLLDEVEPTLYGYARSLLPGAAEDPAPAREHAHALTLAFHLAASAGAIEARTASDLRGLCHRWVLARLADDDPVQLVPLGDPETGLATHACISLGWTLADELGPDEQAAFAARLRGERTSGWPQSRLAALGVLRP